MVKSKFDSKITEDYILKSIERQYFDRKSAKIDLKEFARHIIAFANADGGVIAVGVEDKGEVTGFKVVGETKINDLEYSINTYCKPLPKIKREIIEVQGEKILLFHIEQEIDRIIYRSDDTCYLRIGDKSKELKPEEIDILRYYKGDRKYENEVCPEFEIGDLDETLITEYKAALNASEVSTEQILRARGFIKRKDGKEFLTNAAMLLFSKNPLMFYSNLRVRIIKYEGITQEVGASMNIVKDINVEGNIFKILNEIKPIMNNLLREFIFLNPDSGKFVPVPEYPYFAWEEGIVNALAHREYSLEGAHICILIFDDRMEIKSPGKFPPMVNPKNILNTRFSRNAQIARTMTELGWVRELNEGVKRIFSEMEQFFLDKPIYKERENEVSLTLKNNILIRRQRNVEKLKRLITEYQWKELSEHEKIAMLLAYNNEAVFTKDFAERIGKSKKPALRILTGLCEKNLLRLSRTSINDKNQFYELNDNE